MSNQSAVIEEKVACLIASALSQEMSPEVRDYFLQKEEPKQESKASQRQASNQVPIAHDVGALVKSMGVNAVELKKKYDKRFDEEQLSELVKPLFYFAEEGDKVRTLKEKQEVAQDVSAPHESLTKTAEHFDQVSRDMQAVLDSLEEESTLEASDPQEIAEHLLDEFFAEEEEGLKKRRFLRRHRETLQKVAALLQLIANIRSGAIRHPHALQQNLQQVGCNKETIHFLQANGVDVTKAVDIKALDQKVGIQLENLDQNVAHKDFKKEFAPASGKKVSILQDLLQEFALVNLSGKGLSTFPGKEPSLELDNSESASHPKKSFGRSF